VEMQGFGRPVALRGTLYERDFLSGSSGELHPGHCGYELENRELAKWENN